MTRPILIERAWTQRGWSSCDHMIDDSAIDRCVGRTYRTPAEALRAAARLADDLGFAAIVWRDLRTGRVERWGAEPSLPGRERMRDVVCSGSCEGYEECA